MNHKRILQHLFLNVSNAQLYPVLFLAILFLASHYYSQNHKGHRTM